MIPELLVEIRKDYTALLNLELELMELEGTLPHTGDAEQDASNRKYLKRKQKLRDRTREAFLMKYWK